MSIRVYQNNCHFFQFFMTKFTSFTILKTPYDTTLLLYTVPLYYYTRYHYIIIHDTTMLLYTMLLYHYTQYHYIIIHRRVY